MELTEEYSVKGEWNDLYWLSPGTIIHMIHIIGAGNILFEKKITLICNNIQLWPSSKVLISKIIKSRKGLFSSRSVGPRENNLFRDLIILDINFYKGHNCIIILNWTLSCYLKDVVQIATKWVILPTRSFPHSYFAYAQLPAGNMGLFWQRAYSLTVILPMRSYPRERGVICEGYFIIVVTIVKYNNTYYYISV